MSSLQASSHIMPDTLRSKKKGGAKGTGRRITKSMGDIQNSVEANRKRKDVSQSKDVLRVPPHKTGEAQKSFRPSRNSPFQKAIIANGILDSPVTRGRRMSREEIVTAAVLSQMESKSRHTYSNRKHQRTNDSTFKKSKSAASLAQDSRYIDRQSARKRSLGSEQVILPRIMQNYAISTQDDQVEGISMRKNLSMDTLKRNREKSWGTTELDASYPTFAVLSSDSKPLHPLPIFPYGGSCNNFDQPVSSHSESQYFRRQSHDLSPVAHLHSIDVVDLLHAPQTSPARDMATLRAKPPTSEINRLLSAGINADSTILRNYDLLHPRTEQQMLVGPYGSSRRLSVNISVQTDESRVS